MLHALTRGFAILMLSYMSDLIRYSCSDKHSFLIHIMQNLVCFPAFSFISFVAFKEGHDSFERGKRKMFIKGSCISRKNMDCVVLIKLEASPELGPLDLLLRSSENVMEVHWLSPGSWDNFVQVTSAGSCALAPLRFQICQTHQVLCHCVYGNLQEMWDLLQQYGEHQVFGVLEKFGQHLLIHLIYLI